MSNLVLTSLSSSNRIRRELLHGETYRSIKSKRFGQPICPVGSPLDVTYFVQRKRRVEKVVEEIDSKGIASHGRLKDRARCKSKSVPHIKNSFWERAKLTHKQYADVLSTPHLQSCGDIDNGKKLKSKTTPNLCSPRLIQMSCPTKRRILATWQDFGDQLPAETLQRLNDLLHTDKSIDLKDARNYFKMRDRKKKMMERRRKLRKKKKKNYLKSFWLKEQIEETSSAVMNFFSGNPKLDLSYKQLLISDTLMALLSKVVNKNKPIPRYSSDMYNRQLVRMVDKIALWIDSVSKIVEMQSIEEEEEEEEAQKLPETESSTISSISLTEIGEKEAGTEEGEEEVEEGETEEDEEEYEEEEGEGEERVMSITSLEKLIKILAHASPSYLGGQLEDLENLTRNEILNKIKILNKDYSGAETPAELLKQIITEWAMHNQPTEVDDRVKKKIEDVAELLAAMLAAEDLYGMMPTLPIAPEEGAEQKPGAKKVPSDRKRSSQIISSIDFGEDGEPIPGTVTEVVAPDGSVQLGVVDEDGNLNPVTMTPSGNLMPTVYDKDEKVVDKLYDKVGDPLDSTFNKYGVPEPEDYSGPLYDDEKKPHELIYNEKGNIIPLCYDKDGNPIAPGYDEDGNPIYYGPDGKPVAVPPGGSAKIVGDKLVILGTDGGEIKEEEEEEDKEKEEKEKEEKEKEDKEEEEDEEAEEEAQEEPEKIEDVAKEMEAQGGMGEDETEPSHLEDTEGEDIKAEEEEAEERTVEEEEEELSSSESEEEEETKQEADREKEVTSAAGSRESMITVIPGHKPKKVHEHSKDTVCCLSLKIWAVWLLEITHNAHNWTKWVTNIIGQIREFAAILRGEVMLSNGQKKVLFKNDWDKFVNDMNEDVIAWRQYCRHVNDLTNKIVEKFHGKKVNCCEKCLQDHLIKNVVTAHDTMRSLTEALNCAGYWQRCLDEIVQATTKLTEIQSRTEESSSDEETGWSYSSSSGDDKDDYYCYTKRPSPTWKKISETPCSCPCKLKQLFPKEGHKPGYDHITSCGCSDSSSVKVNKPRRGF